MNNAACAKRLVSWLNVIYNISEEKVLEGLLALHRGPFWKFPFDLSAASNFLSPVSILRSFRYLVTLNLYAGRFENRVTNNN